LVQGGERSTLGRVALAHDLGQTERSELAADGAQPAAGLHGGELSGVTDRDDLRARLLGGLQHARAGPGGRHSRLVENENASLWVRSTSARSVKRSARPRTSLTRAPCLAEAANSCSSAHSSKVLLMAVRPSGPARCSSRLCSATRPRSIRPAIGRSEPSLNR